MGKKIPCIHAGWQHLLGNEELKNLHIFQTYRWHRKYTASVIWDLFAVPYIYSIDPQGVQLSLCISDIMAPICQRDVTNFKALFRISVIIMQ